MRQDDLRVNAAGAREADLDHSRPDANDTAPQGRSTLQVAFASLVQGVSELRAAARVRAGLMGEPERPVLPRYVLRRPIGRGAMGEVWVAHDPTLDREVAIKLVLAGALGPAQAGLERLAREARSLARLSHPNVVQVFDLGTYELPHGERGLFIVMELVDGQPLSGWLATPHTWREVLAMFIQAADGLAAAHRCGLVHRDFKPANVLVATDGRARVGDFGLARLGQSRGRADGVASESVTLAETLAGDLTETGAVMGTPLYMAPEQHEGGTVDARSDQYAFCVAFFEALYGEHPFRGAAGRIAMAKHEGAIAIPPSRTSVVPAVLEAAILRGLRPRPQDRWGSMDELAGVLRRTAMRRRGLPWIIAAVGIATLGVLGIGERAADCDPDELATRHWSSTHRNRVQASLVAAHVESTEWIVASLDGWRDSLTAAAGDACRHDPIRATERWDCLASALREFDAVVTALNDEATITSQEARALANDLSDPKLCVDQERESPIPADQRARVDALRTRLAKAKVLAALRPQQALAESQAVLDDIGAARVADPRLLGEAWFRAAVAYDALILKQSAKAAFENCHFAAAETRDDAHMFRCANRVALLAAEESDEDESRTWLAHAEVGYAGLPRTPQLAAERGAARGVVLLANRHFGEGIAELRSVLDICAARSCPQTLPTSLINLAAALDHVGDAREAHEVWRRAAQAEADESGPESRAARQAKIRASASLVAMGEFARARTELEQWIAELEADDHRDAELLSTAWQQHADILGQQGLVVDALRSAERSLPFARVAYAGSSWLLASELLFAAHIASRAGEYQRALAMYREAEAVGDDRPELMGTLLLARASTLINLGQHQAAVVDARAARELLGPILGAEHGNVIFARRSEGHALSALGRCDEALTQLDHVIAARTGDAEATPANAADTLDARIDRASCLATLGRVAEARTEYSAVLAESAPGSDSLVRAQAGRDALDASITP